MSADSFSARLRAALRARKWTQADLARAAGLSPSIVSRVCSAERAPSDVLVLRVAMALGIEPVQLDPAFAAGLPAETVAGVRSIGHALRQIDSLHEEIVSFRNQVEALKSEVAAIRTRLKEAARAALGQ